MKRRVLAWMTILCLLIMIVSPINGTLAGDAIATPPEATQAPTQEPTEAPTEQPTETPSEEPTEEPTEAPTEEPTEEPTETPNGEEQSPSPTEDVESEPTTEPSIEPTELPTQEPTEAPTEEPSEAPSKEQTAAPEHPALNAGLASGVSYVFVGDAGVPVSLSVSGGVAPYAVELLAKVNGERVFTQEWTLEAAGELAALIEPTAAGEHEITVRIADAAGQQAEASVSVPVAAHVVEYRDVWENSVAGVELTGDWREDILAVAMSQLGYEESVVNFIIENDARHAYTRYGDWYGSMYAEWCGVFVAFCLEYADVPASAYPRRAHVGNYVDAIDAVGAFVDASYRPSRGDLIFFVWEGEEEPSHMGIVENADETTVYTIEGNASGAVRRKSYALDSSDILGYASTAALMEQAGLEAEEIGAPQMEMSGVATTAKDSVNIRAQAKADGAFLRKIKDSGTEVALLGASDDAEGTRWYLIEHEDVIGYIRGDLLVLPGAEATEEPTVDPSEAPAAEAGEEQSPSPTEGVETEETPAAAEEEEIFFDPNGTMTAEPVVEVTAEPTAEATPAPAEGEEEEIFFDPNGSMTAEPSEEPTAAPEMIATDGEAQPEQPEADELSEEIQLWIEETNPSEEMIERAKNAGGLELLVLEENEFIYVRTGKAVARYDSETGYIIDGETGLIVAYLDENGQMIPASAEDAQ